jgi:hypothetical protein
MTGSLTCKHERPTPQWVIATGVIGGRCAGPSAAAMRKTALTVAVSGERRFVVGLRAENESTPGDTQRADAYKMRL